MTETYDQMLARHRDEERIAAEQHNIRLQTMRERHFSEVMQVANPSIRTKRDERTYRTENPADRR